MKLSDPWLSLSFGRGSVLAEEFAGFVGKEDSGDDNRVSSNQKAQHLARRHNINKLGCKEEGW